MAVNLSRGQAWSIIGVGFIIMAFLGYNIWSGTTDRAIIKEQVSSILGNISTTETTQNATLSTLQKNTNLLRATLELVDNNTSINRNMTVTNQEMISTLSTLYSEAYQNKSIEVHNETLNEIKEIGKMVTNLTHQLS